MGVLGTTGALVGCTLMVAGEVIGFRMAAAGNSGALAGWVTELATLTAQS